MPENPFPLTGIQDSFKNTFPLDGKIKLAVSKNKASNGRKKWFPLARKSVSTSRNQLIFQKLVFPIENWFPLAGMENLFKKMFLLDGKTASIDRNI